MGLPGSGKTTLAKSLQEHLKCPWFNADNVRNQFHDWDFSKEGRLRQSLRMRDLCELCMNDNEFAIVDFVAPTEEIRSLFNPDFTIWMNTIESGRFEDTNKVFISPEHYDFVFTNFHSYDEKLNELIRLINTI